MIKYSIKSLLSKKTISILFSLAIFIAVSISMLAINISSQIEEGFYQVDKKYDIIVGPKGSDTQLVMSSLFFSDDPLGTVDSKYLNKISEEYDLAKIIPLAIADYYRDSRIVGTTSDLLEEYQLEEGNLFANNFEIVIGGNVAKDYNLKIGDSLITAHGTSALSEQHYHSPYTVVGILKVTNTSYDNTCFTNVESVHASHEHSEDDENEGISTEELEYDNESHSQNKEYSYDIHYEEDHEHEEVAGYTSLLIKTGNMSIANKLEADFNENADIQVINTTKVLRKLVGNIDMSKQVALLLCGIIIILAILLTCVMSFLMLINLKRDINLFGFLGMKKSKIYSYVIWQTGILVSISIVASLVINKFVLKIANNISSQLGIVLDVTKIYPNEIYITLSYIGIIMISTILYTYIRTKKGN
ncbi:ABC transporter permease [Clostridium celatum]|uniref:Putative hemin transport system permease protein HrtB n=1 Tax=Clostridium celatum DSM 1785 TaxID=545697 RepID=L1Q256_9CLOT|nr:ABC transporter permease [Clostridium celatum]EKY22053.1 efflux ABC transporter, permease protein [Clostridium celatum DSM 1785]MCE9654487.1 ABC transporter permease [Clostridium celatum]MDU3722289.1 ABC transporter permease [Clostridium celatum]MDU6296383.1 ABC transporter permease [Clostridium celatum]